MTIKHSRFIRALLKQPVDATPIWLMRQAGRYLPEYQHIRKQAGSFLKLCKTPELAYQVTMQPIQRYPLDAAVLFSDILTIPEAMQLGLDYIEGEGPVFAKPIRSIHDINQLPIPKPERELSYVAKTIELVANTLNNKLPLIGFAGSPWTIATYMVEGGKSSEFKIIKSMLKYDTKALKQLLSLLAELIIDALNAQIEAGVNAIMLFDTWGNILDNHDYQRYSLVYLAKIIEGLQRKYRDQVIPIIIFTKNSHQRLEMLLESNCDAISIDSTITLKDARSRVGNQIALQGNLDPTILLTNIERIQTEAHNIIASYGSGTGHIFNLGHGVLPSTPPEHVQFLVDAVHTYSKEYHQGKEQ